MHDYLAQLKACKNINLQLTITGYNQAKSWSKLSVKQGFGVSKKEVLMQYPQVSGNVISQCLLSI